MELEKSNVRNIGGDAEYKPSLLLAIFKTIGPFIAFLGIFTFFEECVIRIFQPMFMGKNNIECMTISVIEDKDVFPLPICICFFKLSKLFLGWMIEYFTPNSTVTLVEAYLYGAGVVFMACLYSLIDHPYVFAVLYTGMKMRIACCSVLYRKVKERKSSAEEADRVLQ